MRTSDVATEPIEEKNSSRDWIIRSVTNMTFVKSSTSKRTRLFVDDVLVGLGCLEGQLTKTSELVDTARLIKRTAVRCDIVLTGDDDMLKTGFAPWIAQVMIATKNCRAVNAFAKELLSGMLPADQKTVFRRAFKDMWDMLERIADDLQQGNMNEVDLRVLSRFKNEKYVESLRTLHTNIWGLNLVTRKWSDASRFENHRVKILALVAEVEEKVERQAQQEEYEENSNFLKVLLGPFALTVQTPVTTG